MLTFKFRGTVADVDSTVEGQPHHPTKVVLVDSLETIDCVILPKEVLDVGADLLNIGQHIEVSGEIVDGAGCVAWKLRPWRDHLH